MSRAKKVTFNEFIEVLRIAQDIHSSNDEPIPEISAVNIPKIKSALDQPFITYDGKYLYRGAVAKATALFYGIAAGHVLSNGNKRMACLITGFFWFKQGFELSIPYSILKTLALETASIHDEEEMKSKISEVFKKYRKMR